MPPDSLAGRLYRSCWLRERSSRPSAVGMQVVVHPPGMALTAGNLSQHLGVLESAGLITIEKGYAGKRARTWVTLTKAGQAALAEEITQLKLLISQIERTGTLPD
jgi:hypothetical protein